MCLWDSWADTQHYVKQEWPARQGLEPRSHNVLSCPWVDRSKALLPPLHIKLRLMKNFVKALVKDGSGFFIFVRDLIKKSMKNLKAGIFNGPEIKELMKNTSFDESLNSPPGWY